MAATREARKREMIANLDNDVYLKTRDEIDAARRAHVIVSHGQGDHNAEPLQAETYEASVRIIGYKLGPVLKH